MTTGSGEPADGRPGRGAASSLAWVERIVALFAQSDQVWGTYALDLTLDALRRDGYGHRVFAEQEDHGPFSLLHAAAAHGWPIL